MYMCLIITIAIDCTFLSDTAKKNKKTLLFARTSNIYLVQIEKYSRNHFTYSPYRRPSVSCLSVGPFVRSIYKYPNFVHMSFPSLNAPWKVLESVFLLQPHKDSRADFFFLTSY